MTEIISRNLDVVYKIARMQSANDADDIVQEVFLEYIRRTPQFINTEHERAWFIRTTTHRARNLFKSAWRRRVESLDDVPIIIDFGFEDRNEVREALAKLSSEARTVVYLYYFEQQDVSAIANILQISPSAVKKRLQRAREKLKTILEE